MAAGSPAATARRYADALWQLSRPDPVAAWAIGGFLMGGAAAYWHVGVGLLWIDGLIALIGVVVIQAFASHGLNDVYDWLTGTDRESIGKGTGGTRVIPEGKLSVIETFAVAVLALGIGAGIGTYFWLKYGLPVLILTVLAITAPVVYSLPPFKLVYRPFPELVVVAPSLIGIAIGAELVLSGQITLLSVGLGAVQAFFNIAWYMVSRVPDYEPDQAVGKTTTVVYLGRDRAPVIASIYLAAGLAPVLYLAAAYTVAVLVTVLFYVWLVVDLLTLDPYDPHQASVARLRLMRKTTGHAAVITALLVVAAGGA